MSPSNEKIIPSPPGGFRIYFDEEDDMGEAGL
jgi:hypothetical protein